MFDRFKLIIGDNINILKYKKVLLVGLGGVGGQTFESLVRCGFFNICVIDFDKVDLTNLNRQVLAYKKTIGLDKVDVALNMALSINPDINISFHKVFLEKSNISIILDEKPDFVIDACDSILTKELIIKTCLKNNIPFISVMGTGNKMHPEMLEICDIRKTSYDPIAKKIRKMVNDEKIRGKVPVIYSKEVPLIRGKVGSTAFVPGCAGLMATSYVVNSLLGGLNEK